QRLPIPADDTPPIRNQRREIDLTAGMIPEGGKPQDPQPNKRDNPSINQHAEHQALVHHREHLPAVTDESTPLRPWRDESGRRCVHRAWAESLADLVNGLAGSGASGSIFASCTGFVTAFALATIGLSTDFWAAARPG